MRIQLSNVRLSFPDLFEAKAFNPGDTPSFGATFLIPKGSALDKKINEAILEVARAKWNTKAESILKAIVNVPNKYCYQDGDLRDYDGYAGNMALRSKSKVRPLVIDANKSPLTEADGRPYSGCYVNASLELFAYDSNGNKGISSQLRGVQFYKDGDAFTAGGAADADEFEDVTAGADADDLV